MVRRRFFRSITLITLTSFVSVQVLSVGVVRAETVNLQFDASFPLHAPKVVNGVGFQYDRNGNLESDGERVLFWNVDNLPVRILKDGVETNFFYDADGRRIVKQVGQDKTSRTIYVNQYYQEPSTKFYFAGDRRLATSDGNFYHQDYLGSTILATNQDSTPTTKALSYFPYGSFVNPSTALGAGESMDYLFTGQELDPESALYNYNARLYNPATGVFVSADTAGGSFAYAAGNPLLYTDPSGHYNEIGAGGGGSQDADEALQITISGGGYQPPTVGATGVINPANVVYTPTDISPAGQALLLGMMGFGFGLAGLAQAAPAVIGACGLGAAWCVGAAGGVAAELAAPPGAQLGSTTAMQVGATQALTGKAAAKAIARRLNQAAKLTKQGRSEEVVRLLTDEAFARSVGIETRFWVATDVHPDYLAQSSWYHYEHKVVEAPTVMASGDLLKKSSYSYPTKVVELLLEEWHHAALHLGGGDPFKAEQAVAQWFKARHIPHTPEFVRRYPERAILGPR